MFRIKKALKFFRLAEKIDDSTLSRISDLEKKISDLKMDLDKTWKITSSLYCERIRLTREFTNMKSAMRHMGEELGMRDLGMDKWDRDKSRMRDILCILQEHNHRTPEEAMEIHELRCYARIYKYEFWEMVRFLIGEGFKLKIVNGSPRKIYWEKDGQERIL